MLTKVAVAISILCLVLPATTFAQGFNQGDKEILLNGTGKSDKDFDSSDFSVEGSFGYFFTKSIEGSIRQSVGFNTTENQGSSWDASTRGAVDYHFDFGRFWPFVGGNIGYNYGDDVTDTWEAAIEGGLKFFVNNTTFILGRIEYQWFFNDNDSETGFNDGQFVYTVGLGFKW
jgi:hypothetical protein